MIQTLPCLPEDHMNSDKRTTDLVQLVVRRTEHGVLYAVHDPRGAVEPPDETLNCLFLFCPQGPLNVASEGLSPTPWVCICKWQDLLLMDEDAWIRMDKCVDYGEARHLAQTWVDSDWPLDPSDSLQPLYQQTCRDGTIVFEAFLPSLSVVSIASRIHYRLPAKLAAMMVGGTFAPLSFRAQKWTHAWDDSRHLVTPPVAGRCGDPIYVMGRYTCRFSFGGVECIGVAYLEHDGRVIDVRPVVLRQGGTVDPFFQRTLSPAVQAHVLGVRPYKLPFQGPSVKKAGLPLTPVQVAAGDSPHKLVVEWTPEGGQSTVQLTMVHVDKLWLFEELSEGGGRKLQVCHFVDATLSRYTYTYLREQELDLPAGVHEAILCRTRELRAAQAALDLPPVIIGKEWWCTICKRVSNGPIQWKEHRSGSDHSKLRSAWFS